MRLACQPRHHLFNDRIPWVAWSTISPAHYVELQRVVSAKDLSIGAEVPMGATTPPGEVAVSSLPSYDVTGVPCG